MIIIGLTGPMYAGKTTIANALRERYLKYYGVDSRIMSMAGPLKALARQIGWNGLKDEKGRRLLQLLGTEVCRKCISDSYWTDKFLDSCIASKAEVIICDDVRFDNEAEVCDLVIRITGRDPLIWRLTEWMPIRLRRFVRSLFCHKSELGISKYDLCLDNSGDIHALKSLIDDLELKCPKS